MLAKNLGKYYVSLYGDRASIIIRGLACKGKKYKKLETFWKIVFLNPQTIPIEHTSMIEITDGFFGFQESSAKTVINKRTKEEKPYLEPTVCVYEWKYCEKDGFATQEEL